jgi:hypothetical protein
MVIPGPRLVCRVRITWTCERVVNGCLRHRRRLNFQPIKWNYIIYTPTPCQSFPLSEGNIGCPSRRYRRKRRHAASATVWMSTTLQSSCCCHGAVCPLNNLTHALYTRLHDLLTYRSTAAAAAHIAADSQLQNQQLQLIDYGDALAYNLQQIQRTRHLGPVGWINATSYYWLKVKEAQFNG